MARCVICDKQSDGLSDYNPMEVFFDFGFHELPNGDFVCAECYNSSLDALDEFETEEEEIYE